MKTKEFKNIDTMKKSDLAFELDNLVDDYNRLVLIHEITELVNRLPLITDLEAVKEAVQKIYSNSLKTWGFLFGTHDNIVDMANNLLESQNAVALSNMNKLMYTFLLHVDDTPEATEGLYYTDAGMKDSLLKYYEKKKQEGK